MTQVAYCPRCGKTDVEALGTALEKYWYHCLGCRYVWLTDLTTVEGSEQSPFLPQSDSSDEPS